jgi:hypothetical protein
MNQKKRTHIQSVLMRHTRMNGKWLMNVAAARWPVHPSTEAFEQTGYWTAAKKAKFDYTTGQTEIINDCNYLVLLCQIEKKRPLGAGSIFFNVILKGSGRRSLAYPFHCGWGNRSLLPAKAIMASERRPDFSKMKNAEPLLASQTDKVEVGSCPLTGEK